MIKTPISFRFNAIVSKVMIDMSKYKIDVKSAFH